MRESEYIGIRSESLGMNGDGRKGKIRKNLKLKHKWLQEAKLEVLYERVLEDKLTTPRNWVAIGYSISRSVCRVWLTKSQDDSHDCVSKSLPPFYMHWGKKEDVEAS